MTSSFGSLKQEDNHEFRISLDHTARSCLKRKRKKKKVEKEFQIGVQAVEGQAAWRLAWAIR